MANTSVIGRKHDKDVTILTIQAGKVEFDVVCDVTGYHYSGSKKRYQFLSKAVENGRRCKAACKVI